MGRIYRLKCLDCDEEIISRDRNFKCNCGGSFKVIFEWFLED